MEFKTEQINGIVLHHLKNEKQHLMTVCSSHGAKLTHLNFEAAGNMISTLWEMTLADIKSGAWSKSEILCPFPNRLRDGKYEHEGRTYQFPIDEPINMNAIHGFVKNEHFNVLETNITDATGTIVLAYQYDGSLKYYPFPFLLKVTFIYNLSEKSFHSFFEAKNTGQATMPFGFGWHPYFSFNNSLIHKIKMNIPDLDLVDMDGRQLPTGTRHPYQIDKLDFGKVYMDHTFQIADLNPGYSMQDDHFKLSFEASEELDYIQIFNPKNDEGVAIEPMSCNVDAFNNKEGLTVLSPNKMWSGNFKILFSILEN